jgi:signal transduction histidine kinase
MDQKDVQSLILISTVIIFLFTVAIVALFIIFQKRKSELILKRNQAAKKFENELNTMKIEVREQTLRNIGWELHDNIGQMLTLAKIQLQSISGDEKTVSQVGKTITKSIDEIRNLSKIINPDTKNELDLYESVQNEIDRLNRLNYIEAICKRSGNIFAIDFDKQLVLFRIVQELINNTIKHAKATKIEIDFSYKPIGLMVTVNDNGIGFDLGIKSEGQGISILTQRVKLIKSVLKIDSSNNGTIVEIVIPNEKENNENDI